jgi:2-polyprenyl-6-methoxyphenol hydroxylase-like FAD-dependent oxidoreductase
VLCLDRSRYGSDTVSTHALMRAGVLLLDRWGVLAAIRAAGTPPIRSMTFFYGDDAVPVTLRPSPGVDALYAPRRTVLDTALVDAAAAAGATFRFGTAATGLTRDAGGRVTGVLTQARNGSRSSEPAALVIGADGRSSLVADRVAAAARYKGRTASALVYGYWPGLPVDGYAWCYRPGVSAGAIPTNDGLTCVFAAGPARTVEPLVRAHGPQRALRDLTAPGPLGPLLPAAHPAGNVRFVRGAPAHLRRAFGPGWALVGDAGYWKDPLSTHGITAALRDAELLARAVLAAPAPAQRVALGRYATTRDALSLPMLRVVERIAGHDWSLPEVRALLMQMAAAQTDEVRLLEALQPLAEAV